MGLWHLRLTIVGFGLEEKLKWYTVQHYVSWATADYEIGLPPGEPRVKIYFDISRNFKVDGVWLVRGDVPEKFSRTYTVVCSVLMPSSFIVF